MGERVIIGLAGMVGAGKTTTGDMFAQGHGFRRVSFADPIRSMMMGLGITEEEMRDPVKKEQPHPALCGKTIREGMESLGTAWGRKMIHEAMWIVHFGRRVTSMPLVLCDDVRFQNEVEAITDNGGKVFRLVVPGQEPRVKTDFAVQELTDVEDITNIKGETKQKDIYRYIYERMFDLTLAIDFEGWKQASDLSKALRSS